MSNKSQIGYEEFELAPLAENDLASLEKHYAHEVQNGVATFDTTAPQIEYWQQKLLDSQSQTYPIWVARDTQTDGSLIGWAGVSRFDPKLAYQRSAEFSFYVLDAYQGKGMGRVLMNHAVNNLQNHSAVPHSFEGMVCSP